MNSCSNVLAIVNIEAKLPDVRSRLEAIETNPASGETELDLACILTITHMPYFCDAFQARTEIVKTHEGSQISI